jgi:hypothetical protein
MAKRKTHITSNFISGSEYHSVMITMATEETIIE